jgi:N-methylhydantoinase B
VRLRRGEARASFVMDHGRFGPQGAFGGSDGGPNLLSVERDGERYVPPHLSKDQAVPISAGDVVHVSTPGGGGYGNPLSRDPDLVLRDVTRGYYDIDQAADLFGVILEAGKVDREATDRNRRDRGQAAAE